MSYGTMRQRSFNQDRLNFLWVGYSCLIALLGMRLLQVQVVRHGYYTQLAERNRTQVIYQTAPRGRIYDRNGAIVATNRPAFSLIYLPGKKENPGYLEDLAPKLADELHMDKGEVLEALREAHRSETAYHLRENLPLKTMFKLSELKTIYPGVELIVEARRHYPNGAFAGHLLGYMGKMDKARWRRFKDKGYRVDSWIGRTGLESLFEAELRGVDGEVRMEVDAHGRLKRVLDQAMWKPGGNIRITIDTEIQKAVEEGLRASPSGRGGAVVLDPRTGEVLALASIPTYDPNLFLLPDWDDAKKELAGLPEFNLALSGSYPPGSIFKIITGAAMFNEERVPPEEKVFCPGKFQLGDRTFKCWEKKGHKHQDWIGGLTFSCDVYFYVMGLRAGGDLIERYQRLFRLGEKTRIALTGEGSGHVFGPQGRKARGKGWYDGDTVNLSIGQGELLVTPVQMAVMIAAVANRGTLWRPHFVKTIEYVDGRPSYEQKPEALGRVELKPRTWDLLHQALYNVVKEGTGAGVKVPGIAVAGKTGTAQNPHGDDHAWFVAFAGKEGEEPSLAVSVLVQQGGHGSSAAGPVAKRAIEAAFRIPKPAPPVRPAATEGTHAMPPKPPVGELERPVFPAVTR